MIPTTCAIIFLPLLLLIGLNIKKSLQSKQDELTEQGSTQNVKFSAEMLKDSYVNNPSGNLHRK